MRPDVRGVERDVDRHVAQDRDVAFLRRRAHAFPLAEEEVLEIGLVGDLGLELSRGPFESVPVAQAQVAVPRRPGQSREARLERGEERPVREPGRAGRRRAKRGELLARRLSGVRREVVPGLVENPLLPADHGIEIHPLLRERREVLEGRHGQETVAEQKLRRDQQRIAGKRGCAPVRRAAASDDRQRQDLPEGLAGRLRPVEEPIDPRTEVADAEGPRERRGMKEDSGGTGSRRCHETGV